MTVIQLIEVLRALPADAEVMIESGGNLNVGVDSVSGAEYVLDQYDLDGNKVTGTVYLKF